MFVLVNEGPKLFNAREGTKSFSFIFKRPISVYFPQSENFLLSFIATPGAAKFHSLLPQFEVLQFSKVRPSLFLLP